MSPKRRIFTLFVMIALVAWLLPLGAFIRPSQEKTSCGGKRAFHMCSMMGGQVRTASEGKISYSNASSTERTAKSSVSGGDDFIAETLRRAIHESLEMTFSPSNFIYEHLPLDLLDPPPRFSASF